MKKRMPVIILLLFIFGVICYSIYLLEDSPTEEKTLTNYSQTETSDYSQTETTKGAVQSRSYSSFTNKYGTATTMCAHAGCTNYIAKSGDTNCCVIHSNNCLECHCYIDEDAMYCLSCIEKAVKRSNNNLQTSHTCEVSGCTKDGSYSIEGLNGTLEYYCYEHYYEMLYLYEKMVG